MTDSTTRSSSYLKRPRLARVLTLLVLTISLLPGPVGAAVPGGLPDHMGIGLVASPDTTGINGWMPDTKIPWDYAYQYLTGGPNTGHGWVTWNENGQYPIIYASAASAHGYIPVFSYYQLLYADGPRGGAGGGEADKDLASLNDPATMNAYFSDFALLMKRLGPGNYDALQGFGKPAIVHVEPDLSGFVESAAQYDDPTTVPAAVASSGVADVAAFPNTYQGFNWALLHLRDQYAPNVLLAFHVSPWATKLDVGSSHDPAIDAGDIGARTGAFAADSGVVRAGPGTSTYDLLFTDVLDRDAGFYKYAQNDPGRWWDQSNLTFPNFQRWEQWVARVDQSAGNKPVFVWQIPIGNQYFQTENNTKGHYQDNRAEYFFNHLDELRQTGIIGLLFGGGGGNVTGYADVNKDGISNPPSFCTSDGNSSALVCNDHASTVADDDGGYLRMMTQQYYANPLPVGAIAPNPTGGPVGTAPDASIPVEIDFGSSQIVPPIAVPGMDIELRQNTISNSDQTVLVDFELFNSTGQQVLTTQVPDQRVLVGSVMSTSTVLTLPDDLPVGRYTLKVGVFSSDGVTQYSWTDSAGTLTVAAH